MRGGKGKGKRRRRKKEEGGKEKYRADLAADLLDNNFG